MLQNTLTQKYLDPLSLRAVYQTNKPFPHLVLPRFFQQPLIQDVAHALSREHYTHKDTDLYSFSQTNSLLTSTNPLLHSFAHFLNSHAFKHYLFKITGIKAFGPIDCAGFLYMNRNYLLPHDDSLDTRKIAYTLHLSNDFRRHDGGSLDFFHNNKIVKSIPPRFNTLIIFPVLPTITFHQIREVLTNKQRYSIAGWFHEHH